jgi:hypothetical protein
LSLDEAGLARREWCCGICMSAAQSRMVLSA